MDDPEAFLTIVKESVQSGGAGICIGRNLFQRRPVGPFARRISALLHGTE
jgi:DhnA family fructose-bisphosphate aldolase class Ia